MAEELKETKPADELAVPIEQEPELWDWARAAGVSREELLAAVERSRPA